MWSINHGKTHPPKVRETERQQCRVRIRKQRAQTREVNSPEETWRKPAHRFQCGIQVLIRPPPVRVMCEIGVDFGAVVARVHRAGGRSCPLKLGPDWVWDARRARTLETQGIHQ